MIKNILKTISFISHSIFGNSFNNSSYYISGESYKYSNDFESSIVKYDSLSDNDKELYKGEEFKNSLFLLLNYPINSLNGFDKIKIVEAIPISYINRMRANKKRLFSEDLKIGLVANRSFSSEVINLHISSKVLNDYFEYQFKRTFLSD